LDDPKSHGGEARVSIATACLGIAISLYASHLPEQESVIDASLEATVYPDQSLNAGDEREPSYVETINFRTKRRDVSLS
jgi:hypothetical protein